MTKREAAEPDPRGAAAPPSSSPCDFCVLGWTFLEVDLPHGIAPDGVLRLEAGTERFVSQLELRVGGAANTASVLGQLGCDVALVSPVDEGQDGRGLGGQALAGGLRGLPLHFRPYPTRHPVPISLVFHFGGDRTFITSAHHESLRQCPPLPRAKWFHVPGLLEASLLAPSLEKARTAGPCRVSVSGSWVPERFAWLRSLRGRPIDLLVLNEKEARSFGETPEETARALGDAAAELIITRGAHGAVGFFEDARVEVPAWRDVEVVDPTGAGDAFVAGFLWRRLAGDDGRTAMRAGTEVAARMLTAAGGVARTAEGWASLRGRYAAGGKGEAALDGAPEYGAPGLGASNASREDR